MISGQRLLLGPAGQGLMMPASSPWQPVEFAYVFVMWVVMTIGMMVPSAGSYCVGSCWALMLLLFGARGHDTLIWIAALASLVMLEQVLPFGRAVARLAGLFFVAPGGWMLLPM
jgi:predicted metal-binding membrane protein